LTKRGDETQIARKSARVVGIVLLGIAAWNFWRERPPVWVTTATAGGILITISFLWTAGSVAFHRVWMKFAHVLGWVNTRILLGLMFYGAIAPYGLLMRLFGRDVLRRRGRSQETYWIARPKLRQEAAQFERLF
jgi:hypothetical protein